MKKLENIYFLIPFNTSHSGYEPVHLWEVSRTQIYGEWCQGNPKSPIQPVPKFRVLAIRALDPHIQEKQYVCRYIVIGCKGNRNSAANPTNTQIHDTSYLVFRELQIISYNVKMCTIYYDNIFQSSKLVVMFFLNKEQNSFHYMEISMHELIKKSDFN